jgi:protein HIRA/HIR1
MVVAEVPLWVVHSNAPVGQQKQGATAASAARETGASSGQQQQQQRALESLSLLDSVQTGNVQKAPIYSVDVHGNKFATGGGDGTVRIWNVGALFPKPETMIHGRYVGKQNPAANVTDNEATLSTPHNYESSGESSMEELNGKAGPKTTGEGDENASSSSSSSMEEPVHDLSGLVRRKKDGTTLTEDDSRPAASSPAPVGSPAKPSHSQHNHQKHRLLCTLSAHTGSSVLAVRFSHNGRYLASAGDDAVVCVYARHERAGGNLEHAHVEHWTRIKLCRGHALDAVGLAWAPDDSHLVSCSLDSNTPIIVWNLTDLVSEQQEYAMGYDSVLCNPYKILGKGVHTSTVKGVTFDPAGTYLASSGDDPSVCIWRAHDDWGLEKRIDATSGIFRKWNSKNTGSSVGSQAAAAALNGELSSQSLFRRLSWSTDGAYICSTNAVVKNKHVASTISRQGWAVSTDKTTASGAVNLVGHKQPVVVARHCPYLLNAKEGDGTDEPEDEPQHATLLALGDKRGFVTVWSTRKSRPVFKIQCSESRCTVTDLSWGRLNNEKGDLMLIVSLLDGQVVALRFGIPDELGHLLNPTEQARVFELRYGIDVSDAHGGVMGGRKLFVGGNSGPKFIENALQLALENYQKEQEANEPDEGGAMDMDDSESSEGAGQRDLSSDQIRANQQESRAKGGKKRIQPLLMQTTALPPSKKQKVTNGSTSSQTKKPDTLETAIELAEKAAAGAEAMTAQRAPGNAPAAMSGTPHSQHHHHHQEGARQAQSLQLLAGAQATPQIPHSTNRIHSVELEVTKEWMAPDDQAKFVADCTNSIQVPPGSSGSALPCSVLSLSKDGQRFWNDHLVGTSCSAIAASKSWLIVGTSDGCVHVYGTSPTLGWASLSAFRSHPPFVLGRPIIALHLRDSPKSSGTVNETGGGTELLAVTSDGNFSVYDLEPNLKLQYKGSIMPAMTHMLLSADLETDLYLPKLARIQMTETNRLLLLLSLQQVTQGSAAERSGHGNDQPPSLGAGGSIQGFVYDRSSELWMRVSDSRFILSDFYSTLPLSSLSASVKSKSAPPAGELSKMDDAVRMGSIASTLRKSRLGRFINDAYTVTTTTSGQNSDSGEVASRSHCEDRMACSLALGSAAEFEYWFSMYVRTLAMTGDETLLRMTVDMLMGSARDHNSANSNGDATNATPTPSCWWLSHSPSVLKFDRIKLIRTVVIPEMSKNRELQRVTQEIAIEVNALTPEQ